MSKPDAFQTLCQEAVAACGTDIDAIETYVRTRMEQLDPADREKVERDLQRVLGFRAPDHPPFDLN